MVKIFYPYWAGGSKWEELRYSLRSLEKNFKEDFVVYLVGDLPDWVKKSSKFQVSSSKFQVSSFKFQVSSSKLPSEPGEMVYIPYQRDEAHSALWNTTRMMELFMEQVATASPRNDGDLFIRMNDDIYLIGERTLDDLMVTRIVRMPEEVGIIRSGGAMWRCQVLQTYEALTEREYAGYMTESHCPEVYSARKLNLIYKSYELPESELLPSTLYYNVFPYERQLIDRKAERALFYGEENAFSYLSVNVAEKCRDRYFLNHNNEGLNEELKRFIEGMFPEKGRFEKL